jgi:hypothetical protein
MASTRGHGWDDGAVARRTYLDRPVAGAAPTDSADQLLQRRRLAEAEVEELKVRQFSASRTATEFERRYRAPRVGRDIRADQTREHAPTADT